VATVYLAPQRPIQNFKNTPIKMAHKIEVPNIAPVLVASITSPEPIYSAHHTIDGPIIEKIINPRGGFFISLKIYSA
jgi:hypothetical protein